ncbi:MAG TPA: hypothetical protein VLC74_12695 [Rhizomicrobium sp.]|nr:hypothetical protein [Rhizomicrobium sp.]
MTDFEGLFGLFGLMFGLIVAELAFKFADAIDSNRERPMGILTPALAFLVLTDVTSFWLFIWSARNALTVNWHTVFIGVLVALVYFLAATLVFPRKERGWAHLDDHYWSRKRLVAGGILLANAVVAGMLLTRAIPAWNDWLFYFYFVGYYVAIAGLIVSRSRRVDYVLLAWAISINLLAGLGPLPNSEWGKAVGLSFSAQSQPDKRR